MTEVAEFNEVYEVKGQPYNQYRFIYERKHDMTSDQFDLSSVDYESSELQQDDQLVSDNMMSMMEHRQ